MDIRSNAGDAHVVDAAKSHLQVFGNVVVLGSGYEAEFVFLVVDGHGVGVEGVVALPDKTQPCAYVQVLKGFAAFPIAEARDVKIGEANLSRSVFICSHNA